MARKFAPISEAELKEKVEKVSNKDFYALVGHFQKDLKVKFDCENYEWGQRDSTDDMDGLMGPNTLSNGLTFWGMSAGGDWEHPVFFIVYWDGKKLRAYVPTDGNPWNTTTKQAYGNDETADAKNAKKRWPEQYEDIEDEIPSDEFEFSPEEIKQDILSRLQPA